MTGVVLFWGWLALSVRRFDRGLGIALPTWLQPVGVGALIAGGALGLSCAAVFVMRGQGTPAPFDPPRQFVAVGPYRYVRNPMYVGGLVALAGLGLYLRSISTLLLTVCAGALVQSFVVLVEERGLESRFGASYQQYKVSVRRWLPRWPGRGGRSVSTRRTPFRDFSAFRPSPRGGAVFFGEVSARGRAAG